LKTVLLRALGACKDLSISVEAATYLDVTAVQLLWAAGEQARRSGVGFHIIGGLPEAIAAGLADAGFPAFLSTANAEQNRGV
jgi:anti-anti-sigma regulatory factor